MQIHTLRVERKNVGTRFPFDRAYLVKHEDREQVERMFRVAMVMPVDDRLAKMIGELELNTVRSYGMARDDESSAPRKPKKNQLKKLLEDEWLLVIPILPKWVLKKGSKVAEALAAQGEEVEEEKKDGEGHEAPNYITAPRWMKRHPGDAKDTWMSRYAYLQIPERKVRPICVACPRVILHQNGECNFGEEQCYPNLALGIRDYFREGQDAPDAPETEKDKLLKVTIEKEDATNAVVSGD